MSEMLDEMEEFLNEMISERDNEAFFEMAGRIPRDQSGRFKLVIAVGSYERNIAHFHVFRSEEDLKSWKNGACLFFTENKYYDHSDNTETLTRDELKEVVKILTSIHPKLHIQNWKYLVVLWNDNNYRYEISDDTPMPNYDHMTITRYKEQEIKK